MGTSCDVSTSCHQVVHVQQYDLLAQAHAQPPPSCFSVTVRVLILSIHNSPVPGPMGAVAPDVDLGHALALANCGPFTKSPKPSSNFEIGGTVSPGWEPVRDGFASNFERGLERNAQLCIYKNGIPVVDLWGTNTEPGYSTAPPSGYDGDTLQIVYSSTKAAAATVFALAVDRGLFNYDDTVASIWPEFAQNGKENITIADVLRHDAGLHAFDEDLTLEDTASQADLDGNMSRIIAAQKPWAWRSGPDEGITPRIYHAVSRGFILNQILLRADPKSRTIGQWMHEELCGPLKADFHCGSISDSSWLDKPRAEMQVPDPAFVFANATVPAAVRRESSSQPVVFPCEVGIRERRCSEKAFT